MSINEDLRELSELHDAGTLSDEEFEVAKERLLHGDQATETPQAPPTKESGCSTALVVILVIVISIPVLIFALGFIATVIARQDVLSTLDRASVGTVKANITTICQAVDNFTIINNGRHPESLEQLVTPDENGETYLNGRKVPDDPWGNEFLYDPPISGTRGYRVYTHGADGIPGGEGDDRDIDNWMIEDREV